MYRFKQLRFRHLVAVLFLCGLVMGVVALPTMDEVQAAPIDVSVNFQPSGSAVPDGYLADTGAVYGDQGNGYSYGWLGGANTETRDRGANTDQRYDTLNHMQKGDPLTWEIALPNGEYTVHVVAGDPSYTDQVNTLDIEGVVMTDPDGEDNFDEYDVTVTVSDGRLTVAPAAGASNAKLCFIDITGESDPSTGTPTPTNTPTNTPTATDTPPVSGVRIEAGGNADYTDSSGNVWLADTACWLLCSSALF
jgi:hypothetical protein